MTNSPPQGSGSGPSSETIVFDYDINNNPIYIGFTKIGGAKSDAIWKIKKLIYDVNKNVTDIQYAESNDNYDNIWNNRATYSYG